MASMLNEHLEKVLNSGSLSNMTPIEKAIHGPGWSKSDEGKVLIEYLNNDDAYSEFNEHLQTFGNSASSVKLLDLADWLVERALVVGSMQAEKDLADYNNSNEFDAYAVMLLADTFIDNEYEFYNGVKLIHASSFPNKSLIRSVQLNSYGHSFPLPKINSILVAPFKHKKFHWPNTDLEVKRPAIEIPYSSLEEVKLCLVLSRPIGDGIQSIATSVMVTDNVPIIRSSMSGWSLRSFKMSLPAPSVLVIEMNNANEILKKLRKLNPEFKIKILNFIERLNGYSSGASMVERAIDLRICLESIFLDDGNKEQLRYTLSLRAALFLGKDLDERKAILSKIKKAYDVTSTAVHTGKMPKKNVNLLPEVAGMARKSILKLIETGEINWQEVELQA